jgi:hypothetical protein
MRTSYLRTDHTLNRYRHRTGATAVLGPRAVLRSAPGLPPDELWFCDHGLRSLAQAVTGLAGSRPLPMSPPLTAGSLATTGNFSMTANSGLREEAITIIGKGIDAWRDAICELQSESGKAADTVRDPCWRRPGRCA